MKTFLIAGLFLIFTTLSANAEQQFNWNPGQVNLEIKSLGKPAVIKKYFRCGDDRAYSQIETGNKQWLDIGAQLLPDSTGCVTDNLQYAFSVAMLYAPLNVLPYVETTPLLPAVKICVPLAGNETTQQKLSMLDRMQRTIGSVRNKKYDNIKNTCLDIITQYRKVLH